MGSYLKIDPIRLGKFNNAEYTNFMNRFTLANKLDDGKTVRLELDEQYDDLVTIAFVTSVATPSKEATDFVMHMNKLMLIPILLIISVAWEEEGRHRKGIIKMKGYPILGSLFCFNKYETKYENICHSNKMLTFVQLMQS